MVTGVSDVDYVVWGVFWFFFGGRNKGVVKGED